MKIRNLQVQPHGPLDKKLEIEPKGLNLIYGRNETGKTFLLETMTVWLFGKGRHSPLKKVARAWDPMPSGSIEVSGVVGLEGESNLILNSSSKKNLQDYLVAELGMPRDLSELLLVRAGDTLLENPDDLVKRSLSASGMLQEIIDQGVSRTLQNSSFENGQIQGHHAGEIKRRNELKNKLTSLGELRGRYAQEQGSELDGLEEEISDLESEINKLQAAKKFRAYQVSQEMKTLLDNIEKQPKDLDELEDKIEQFKRVRTELSGKSNRVASLTEELKHKDWADHAYARYRELEAKRMEPLAAESGSNPVFLILFIGALLATGGLYATLGLWGAVGGGVASIAFLLLWLLVKKEHQEMARGEDVGLKKIRVEFKEKFGDELISEAYFQTKVEQLILYQGQKEESLRDLAELRNKETELFARLETRLGKHPEDTEIEEWNAQVSAWKKYLSELEQAAQSKKSELDRLGIPDAEFLNQDPGVAWDAIRFQESSNELELLKRRSREAQVELGELKTEIAAMTQTNSVDWEELISGLEQKIGEAESEYQEITAEILGKIALVSTVHELQEKEDELITQNLGNSEFNQDIKDIIGGRVNGFTWEGGEMKLVRQGLENQSREFLSTGVNEQLMIALRILFARHYLKEQPCFLLLDDAFQYSDWERRERLVDHVIRLVLESRWQVFYFTMDDHIRDLFVKKATNLIEDDFHYQVLDDLSG